MRACSPAASDPAVTGFAGCSVTMHSMSGSKALNQAYEDHQERLDEVLTQMQAPAEASGVAFVLDGKVAGVDLFDQPATLSKLWPKLVRVGRMTRGASRLPRLQRLTWVRTTAACWSPRRRGTVSGCWTVSAESCGSAKGCIIPAN